MIFRRIGTSQFFLNFPKFWYQLKVNKLFRVYRWYSLFMLTLFWTSTLTLDFFFNYGVEFIDSSVLGPNSIRICKFDTSVNRDVRLFLFIVPELDVSVNQGWFNRKTFCFLVCSFLCSCQTLQIMVCRFFLLMSHWSCL